MGVWWKDESAFKVGDRVRLKGHPYKSFSSNVGVIVDRSQSHKRGDWDVLADDSEDAFSFREDEMELLSAARGSKFKIGDRVRATADAPRGEVGTIREDFEDDGTFLVEFDTWRGGHDGDGGLTGGRCWWLADGEMELLSVASATGSKFKVGDRVRVVADPFERAKPGHLGVVAEVDDTYVCVEMDYPFDGHGSSGHCWNFFDPDDELAVAGSSSKPLRIEAGKFYKTRDGRKVGPMVPSSALGGYPWTDGRLTWTESGAWHDSGVEDEEDIIAEWQDEPAPCGCAAAEVDNQRDEYGPFTSGPKFKVGDRVSTGAGYTFDPSEGTVTAVNVDQDSDLYRVGDIDHPRAENRDWHYRTDQLRLVAPATSGKSIVARIDNGQPRPATRPYVHPDRAAAIAEAERLARTNPGKEFGVYELVGTRREAKVYTSTNGSGWPSLDGRSTQSASSAARRT